MNKHIGTLIGIVAFLLCLTQTYAIGVSGIGGYPTTYDPNNTLSKAWFIYNLKPGESKEDSLTIENYEAEAKTVTIAAVDSTVNNMGGFALEMEGDTKDLVGSWIMLSETEITLGPGEKKDVPFTFTVPANISEPGEYSGAITVQEKKDMPQEGGINIATRIGIRVYETVPGEVIRSLAISGFTAEYDKVHDSYIATAAIKNTGNVTTEAKINFVNKQLMWGSNDTTLAQNMRIPPHGDMKVNFTIPNPKWGKFGMQLETVYADKDNQPHQLLSDPLTFWAIPWVQVAWVALLIALNIAYLCFYAIKRSLAKRNAREYTVKTGDTVEKIAERFGMKWKQLVKLNHIKKPYELKTKQKLLVKSKKAAKGTKLPAKPVRAWATVTVSMLILIVSLSAAVWGITQTNDESLFKTSILESLMK